RQNGGTPVSPLAAIVAPGANARDVFVTRAGPPHGSLTTTSFARMLRRGPGADPCCELRRAVTRPPEKHVIATGPISPRRLRHHTFLPEQHHLVQALRRAQLRWIGLGYACKMLAESSGRRSLLRWSDLNVHSANARARRQCVLSLP